MSDDVEIPIHGDPAAFEQASDAPVARKSRARRAPRSTRANGGPRGYERGAPVVVGPAAGVGVQDEPEVAIEPGATGPPSPPEPPSNGHRRWRRGGGGSGGDGRPPRPKVRKLRLLAIVLGLGTLAAISTIFGMMMAVASDIPQLENKQQYKLAQNSYLYDDHWNPIGIFAPPNHVVIDHWKRIAPSMVDAIVAIEDKRFWSDPGVDIRGIARAFFSPRSPSSS
jgi:hypothetical protein